MSGEVKVLIGKKGLSFSNILWAGRFPMYGGVFPKNHPCSDNPKPTVFTYEEQPATNDRLGRFRARGYLASCFPEGDGISFAPIDEARGVPEICQDIVECFDVTISNRRSLLAVDSQTATN